MLFYLFGNKAYTFFCSPKVRHGVRRRRLRRPGEKSVNEADHVGRLVTLHSIGRRPTTTFHKRVKKTAQSGTSAPSASELSKSFMTLSSISGDTTERAIKKSFFAWIVMTPPSALRQAMTTTNIARNVRESTIGMLSKRFYFKFLSRISIYGQRISQVKKGALSIKLLGHGKRDPRQAC